MGAKSIIGTFLILLGLIGLIIGVFGVFGRNLTAQNPWIFAILGLIFFSSGIGLLKSTGTRGA
jgi:uncharacterized membrane protein